MDEDLSSIFDQVTKDIPVEEVRLENTIVGSNYDYGQSVITEIENEYKGLGSAKAEREKEKAELNEKIKLLQSKLRKLKNVKNHRRTNINADIASKRKAVKAEIDLLKDRLYEIAEEEKGSSVTSGTLMESTLLSNANSEIF